MNLSAIIILCCTVLFVSAVENGNVNVINLPEPTVTPPNTTTTAPTTTTVVPSNSTTTVKPSPTPTPSPNATTTTVEPSPSPNTTTTTTTTTTVKPSPTPTPSPNTTTTTVEPSPSPNTTTTTTTTTTVKPSPTPTPSPNTTTTTVKPTPAPAPDSEPTTGNWILNSTDKVCIIVKMALQFNITYQGTDKQILTKQINLPKENMTQVTGNCNNTSEQNMTISWMNGTNNITLHFVNSDKTYALHHIEAVISIDNLPKINSNNSLNFTGDKEYKAHSTKSYKCSAKQTIPLKSYLNGTSAKIEISNLQFQAFRTENTTNFGTAEDCVDVTDIVPIAVGCVLIALVVLVLVAYLIGRRNSQARGYLSM